MLTALPLTLAQSQPARPKPTPEDHDVGAGSNFIFLLVFMFAFIWLFIIRPQKREQDEKQTMLSALKKNDRVVTTGGMFGTIVNIKDDEVTLRIDDQAKVKVRYLKSAVSRLAASEQAKPSGEDKKN
jgi:preprotein translocase subunit YajC